jgi:hypothetical protein
MYGPSMQYSTLGPGHYEYIKVQGVAIANVLMMTKVAIRGGAL